MDPDDTTAGLDITQVRLAVSAAAIAGDSGTLYHLVSGLMDEGVPLDSVLFDLLVPTQRDVGNRWQEGDYLVAEEHAATATVETVVSLLAGALDQPADAMHVVVAAAQGDHHSLPARLVATYLLFMGYRTTFLGANVLAADLSEYLEVESPKALVLSCAMTGHLLGARATVRAAHRAGTPVIVGGRGFGAAGEWGEAVGADAWASNAREIPEILDSWEPDPVSAESRAPVPSPELTELVGARAAVLSGAEALLARRPLEVDSRARDELAILLEAVEASLLVGDDRPVVDTLAWQHATLSAHGLPLAEAVATSLETALTDGHPDAAAVLSRSRPVSSSG